MNEFINNLKMSNNNKENIIDDNLKTKKIFKTQPIFDEIKQTNLIYKDSSLFFYDFIERNDILLDYNYDKILNFYNLENNEKIDYGIYRLYFNIFENYIEMKSKIYIFYYILSFFLS